MATTGYSANDADVRRRIVELPDSPINDVSIQQAPLQQQEDDLKKTIVINAKKSEVCLVLLSLCLKYIRGFLALEITIARRAPIIVCTINLTS